MTDNKDTLEIADLNAQKKILRRNVLKISFPLMLQNLVSTVLNLADTFLIGRLGGAPIAAVGLANNLFFLFILVSFGVNSGVSIFTAQFFGKSDERNMTRSVSLAILAGVAISAMFTLGGVLFPERIIGFFIGDSEVVRLGGDFLFITAFSFIFTAISFSISFAYRSVGRPKAPLAISVLAIAVNIFLNIVLIPIYGVKGSAFGTLTARIMECALMIWWLRYDGTFRISIRDVISFEAAFAKRVMKTAMPVIANEGVWALGIVMYSVAFAKLGTEAVASVQITNSVLNVLNVVFMGIGNAAAIMIGREIGAKRFDMARRTADEINRLTLWIAIFMTAFTVAIAYPVSSIFSVSRQIADDAAMMIMIAGLFSVIKSFNMNMIVGILRSRGDTKFTLLLEIGSIWFYGVPMAMLGAFIFGLPLTILYLVVTSEEAIKLFAGMHRYRSGRWLKNLVDDMG